MNKHCKPSRTIRRVSSLVVTLFFALGLAACANVPPKSSELSGVISDYSRMSKVENPSGHHVLRYVDPNYTRDNYPNLHLQPVFFFPEPEPTDQVSAKNLEEIRLYFDTQLRKRLATLVTMKTEPGPGTATARIALTSVSAKMEGLKVRELIPVKAVIAGINYAAGGRDFDTTLITEIQITDSSNGKVLVEAANKGDGLSLENAKEQLSLEHLRPLIDKWVKDIELGFTHF